MSREDNWYMSLAVVIDITYITSHTSFLHVHISFLYVMDVYQWHISTTLSRSPSISLCTQVQREMIRARQQVWESLRLMYWLIVFDTHVIDIRRWDTERNDTRAAERWGAGVETQQNVRGEIGGWGRVPFNETYAPLSSTIYDGA